MKQFISDTTASSGIAPDRMQNHSGNAVAEHAASISESQRWDVSRIEALLDLPFSDLIHHAQLVHRQHHDANTVQLSTLISVKTGGCPEDCGYCPQAARYHTGVEDQDMLSLDQVVVTARAAKAQGASRFCMGAAWRGPKQRDIDKIAEMISSVK